MERYLQNFQHVPPLPKGGRGYMLEQFLDTLALNLTYFRFNICTDKKIIANLFRYHVNLKIVFSSYLKLNLS